MKILLLGGKVPIVEIQTSYLPEVFYKSFYESARYAAQEDVIPHINQIETICMYRLRHLVDADGNKYPIYIEQTQKYPMELIINLLRSASASLTT